MAQWRGKDVREKLLVGIVHKGKGHAHLNVRVNFPIISLSPLPSEVPRSRVARILPRVRKYFIFTPLEKAADPCQRLISTFRLWYKAAIYDR
jgi:hypothetical protein